MNTSQFGWDEEEDLLTDLYAGQFQLIPPVLWWATGDGTLALMAFTAITIVTTWSTWRLSRRIFFLTRWVVRHIIRLTRPKPTPQIVWNEEQ